MLITFDKETCHFRTCQVFLLYSIANWYITSVKHFYLTHKKYAIILYYYSIFFSPRGGVVYILEQMFDCRKGHIWCSHASTPILSSIHTSSKPTKIKHFTTFHTIKKHHCSTKNPLNALKNKASIELNRKSHSINKISSNKPIKIQSQNFLKHQ